MGDNWTRKLINTLKPTQNGCHFRDDTFIFEFPLKCEPKFVPRVPNNNIPVSVQMMAWGRPDII